MGQEEVQSVLPRVAQLTQEKGFTHFQKQVDAAKKVAKQLGQEVQITQADLKKSERAFKDANAKHPVKLLYTQTKEVHFLDSSAQAKRKISELGGWI